MLAFYGDLMLIYGDFWLVYAVFFCGFLGVWYGLFLHRERSELIRCNDQAAITGTLAIGIQNFDNPISRSIG